MTSVWFDDLNLLLADAAEEAAAIAADGYFFEVAGKDDGTELTNAEAIVSSVTSDLFDGASHEVTGWESASLPLRVQVVSPTPGGLAAGAARLIATCRKPGIRPLSFTLQDAAPTSVFDVLVATWVHEFDDLDSDLRHRRTYMLTLRCKPFARSETAVSLPGLAVGGAYSETVVATGASTTGWSTTSRYVTRRNLALTPSFEHGTSYSPWVLSGGTSAAAIVSDGGAPSGSKVLRVTSKALDADPRSYMAVALVSVTPGQEVPITHRIKAGHSSQTVCGVFYRWYDGAGQQIGAGITAPTVPLTTSAFATVSTTATAPAGATGLRVYPFAEVDSPQPAGRIWYLDATAVIDPETVATTTYFDGDSPDASGLTYDWKSGTGDISIETALGSVGSTGVDVFPHGSTTSVLATKGKEDDGINLTYTASIDVSAHRYIRIKAKREVNLDVDGVRATRVAVGTSGSYWTYFFSVPASITTTATSVTVSAAFLADWAEERFDVNEIATVSGLSAGTGRSIARAVSLVGSMPAEASIEVTNNGNPLGDHLVVYSGSEVGGFTRLRSYRTAGPTQTANPNSISGFLSTVSGLEATADTFRIPVDSLTEATYLFTAHVAGAALTVGQTYTFYYRASIIEDPSGTPAEYGVVTGSQSFVATSTETGSTPFPISLAMLNLPSLHVTVTGTSSAVVQIKLWDDGSASLWTLDEAWLADVDNGQVSVIDFATAGVSGKVTSLEIVPAAADRPQQQYLAYSGTAPNQTVREIIPTGWASHRFDPADGDAQVTVINTATTPGLSVAIEFYPRWDVYAAPIVTDADPEA